MVAKFNLITLFITLFSFGVVQGQTNTKDMKKDTTENANNPLLCDIETGMCETGETENSPKNVKGSNSEKVKLVYFTDPICSSCWELNHN